MTETKQKPVYATFTPEKLQELIERGDASEVDPEIADPDSPDESE